MNPWRDAQPFRAAMSRIGVGTPRKAVRCCLADSAQDPWHGRTFDMLARFESGLDGLFDWSAGGDVSCDKRGGK